MKNSGLYIWGNIWETFLQFFVFLDELEISLCLKELVCTIGDTLCMHPEIWDDILVRSVLKKCFCNFAAKANVIKVLIWIKRFTICAPMSQSESNDLWYAKFWNESIGALRNRFSTDFLRIQIFKKLHFTNHYTCFLKSSQAMSELENEWLFWSVFFKVNCLNRRIKVIWINFLSFLNQWVWINQSEIPTQMTHSIDSVFLCFSHLPPCLYDTVSTTTGLAC